MLVGIFPLYFTWWDWSAIQDIYAIKYQSISLHLTQSHTLMCTRASEYGVQWSGYTQSIKTAHLLLLVQNCNFFLLRLQYICKTSTSGLHFCPLISICKFGFSPFQIQDQIKNKGVLNFDNSSKIVWKKEKKQNKKQSSLPIFNYPLSSVLSHVYYFLHLFYHIHPSVTCWVLSFLRKVWKKKSS